MRDLYPSNFYSIITGLLFWLPTVAMAAPPSDDFDHFTTGFPLTGGHRVVECDACHITGNFSGTSRECAACHSALMNTGAVIKGPMHIQSSNECETCHTTLAWDDVRRVNHMSVLGQCRDCHLSDVPGTHVTILPGEDCIACHRTSTWLAIHYNHASAGPLCDTCHDGTRATGKNSGHMSTSNQCSDCHTTHSWAFNHPSSYNFMRGHRSASCSACHPGGYTPVGTYTDDFAYQGTCAGCHFSDYQKEHGSTMKSNYENCRRCHGFGDWD